MRTMRGRQVRRRADRHDRQVRRHAGSSSTLTPEKSHQKNRIYSLAPIKICRLGIGGEMLSKADSSNDWKAPVLVPRIRGAQYVIVQILRTSSAHRPHHATPLLRAISSFRDSSSNLRHAPPLLSHAPPLRSSTPHLRSSTPILRSAHVRPAPRRSALTLCSACDCCSLERCLQV